MLRGRSHPRYGAPRISSKVEDGCQFWSPSAALPHEYFRIAIQDEWRCAPADNPQRQVRCRSWQRLFRGSQCSFITRAFFSSWLVGDLFFSFPMHARAMTVAEDCGCFVGGCKETKKIVCNFSLCLAISLGVLFTWISPQICHVCCNLLTLLI